MASARFGAEAAFRCVLLLSVFPFAFYFSAVYSESLFLLLAVASLYLGERGRWAGGLALRAPLRRHAGARGWPSRPRSASSTSSGSASI